MAWSSEDRRAEVGDCLWLRSWWLWGVLDLSPAESQKLFVACVILIFCWLCGTYWGFGVWCQLAREPPSEWIATTRTSLPASKWTLVKNHCIIIWFRGDWSSLIFILLIDWFIPQLGGMTILSLSLHYRKLVVKLFSVASCESLLVWLVWLFS